MAEILDVSGYSTDLIKERTVAILGYGNQGRSHALNLRDSGVEVKVGQRPGARFDLAQEEGFMPTSLSEAAKCADVVVLGLPDQSAADLYEAEIAANLRSDAAVLFIHGFNVVFDAIQIARNHDVIMVSPKAAGYAVRQNFVAQLGTPMLVSVEQDESHHALDLTLSYALALGSRDQPIFKTTFREETLSDLFGEQAVLCGGIPALIHQAFETLVRRGIDPKIAYFECLYESKIIVDLIFQRGIAGMRQGISGTAAFGGLLAEFALTDAGLPEVLEKLFDRIESGQFAEEWLADARAGSRRFKTLMTEEAGHQIESVDQQLRMLMKR